MTQQIELKIARKVKDEIRKTEKTIVRILGSLSTKLLNGDINSMSVGSAPRREENGQDCLEFYGLDSDLENVIPESVFTDPQTEVHNNWDAFLIKFHCHSGRFEKNLHHVVSIPVFLFEFLTFSSS